MSKSWPFYDEEQIEKVSQVLRSGKVNYWTGEEGRKFEEEFSNWCGTKYSVSVCNGSTALSLALHALNIKRNDEIIVTPRSFIISASAPVLVGAVPVFADVDPDSQSITAKEIEKCITNKTKAICVVHLGGWPAEMEKIKKLAKRHNISIIEDCAQAHGAQIRGKSVGSFGDISCWSFCQDKIMSTGGEGGMICTSNKSLYETIWSLKDHGKSRKLALKKRDPRRKDFNWLHEKFGTNLRLTEIQSSIGRIQLKKMDIWQKHRENNANILIETLKDNPAVRIPIPSKDIKHAWYKFYLFVRLGNLSKEWSRQRILQELYDKKVTAYSGSCGEIYLEKSFQKLNLKPKYDLKIAKQLARTSLMFQVDPSIDHAEMKIRAKIINNVLLRSLK